MRVLVRINEEKGSDVNLGARLLHDALSGPHAPLARKVIVVTNDSDLETPLELIMQAGIEVGIVNPHSAPTNRRLLRVATFEIPFRREVLEKCQLPNVVVTSKGKQVHRPQEWR